MHSFINALKQFPQPRIEFNRKIVQYLFLATVLWIGVQFTLFVRQLEAGILPTVNRPPGVEAFLPISSLISLKYWVVSGVFNLIHPSGLVILLIVLGTAIFLKRGFCSWVCPFGLLTEYLNRIHHFIFKKNIKVSRWLDTPLRSLKYLLLSYFLWVILVRMDSSSLEVFIYGPYNRVADIKMLHFFSDISRFAFFTLLSLLTLSLLVRNFWCRYLCPYGALLGALSLFCIFKVHRNEATCTSCKKCTRVCPVDIQVHSVTRVFSDECHACLNCVNACPEEKTLYFSLFQKRGILRPLIYAMAISLLFVCGTTTARITGSWHNAISNRQYLFYVTHLNLSFYQHNPARVPRHHNEAWRERMRRLRQALPNSTR
jgi:polyferredoxin